MKELTICFLSILESKEVMKEHMEHTHTHHDDSLRKRYHWDGNIVYSIPGSYRFLVKRLKSHQTVPPSGHPWSVLFGINTTGFAAIGCEYSTGHIANA